MCRSERRQRHDSGRRGQLDVHPAVAQGIEHEGHVVQVGFQRIEQRRRARGHAVAGQKPRFHLVGKLAEAHRPGHARAALERVQSAPQFRRVLGDLGITAPRAQCLAGAREKFGRFLEEDRQHLGVDVVGDPFQRVPRRRRPRRFGDR